MTYRFRRDSSVTTNNMKVELWLNDRDSTRGNFSGIHNQRIAYGMNANLTYRFRNNELYSVKIYNRTLSDEEIRKNFSIDQARYSIPS